MKNKNILNISLWSMLIIATLVIIFKIVQAKKTDYSEFIEVNNNSEKKESIKEQALRYYSEGLQALDEHNPKKAILKFRKSAELDPKNYFTYIYMGDAYLSLGNKKMAKAAYASAIKLDEDREAGYLRLGDVFIEENQNKQALYCYTKALHINYTNADTIKKINTIKAESNNDFIMPIPEIENKDQQYTEEELQNIKMRNILMGIIKTMGTNRLNASKE